MSNHFHIFVYVPKAEDIGEEEILRRIRALYRDASLAQVIATWNRLKTEERELFRRARPTRKYVSRFEAYKASFVRRMWNSSEFMRTFKQHFTMSFNGCHEKSMHEAMSEVLKAREEEKGDCHAGRDAAPSRSKADRRLSAFSTRDPRM